MGRGKPIILLHGFFSNADTNWIKFGHAETIAARGYRVIMPDLRAHGSSARPHDPEAYPADILAQDGLDLIAHLGLTDYVLGGYSLGARTVVRMYLLGARPERLIVGGMGLAGLADLASRAAHFRNVLTNIGKHSRNSPEWMAEAFLKTVDGDPVALLQILNVFTNTSEAEIRSIDLPCLVLSGAEDQDNGSASELADILPDATHVEVPGNHMSCVIKPEFGAAIGDWLDATR
jgi:pimeloyl-ACP methyl ester carboxylesterase